MKLRRQIIMFDLRCALVAIMFAVVATAAVAQERPGPERRRAHQRARTSQ